MGDVARLLRDETCIGCGSTIRVVDGPRWFECAWESKNWSMRTFKWCPGGFLLCRREAFREIGGFSEEHYLFEEADFVARLKRYGATQEQKFVILHEHPFSTSGRRGDGQGFWWWARFAVLLKLFHERSVRDRKFAQAWYKPGR